MPDVNMDRLEVERVLNLVQGFQWEKTSEEVTDDYIIITIRKPRQSKPETSGGPGD